MKKQTKYRRFLRKLKENLIFPPRIKKLYQQLYTAITPIQKEKTRGFKEKPSRGISYLRSSEGNLLEAYFVKNLAG
jgi:hypothetical protein